jgi:hypothetical protein
MEGDRHWKDEKQDKMRSALRPYVLGRAKYITVRKRGPVGLADITARLERFISLQ